MKIFESSLPNDYRKEEIGEILGYVTTGKFCQLVCAPGAGKATVLRLLAHNRAVLRFHLGEKEKPVRFIYLNLFELTNYTEDQITKLMLVALDEKAQKTDDPLVLKKQLSETVNKLFLQGQSLIFMFDHFDEYQNRLPRSFFQLLKSLKNVAKFKFAVIFATRRDLKELIDPEIFKEFYDFFTGNTVYLKVFDPIAVSTLFGQIEKIFAQKLKDADKKTILGLTGGHIKLTKVLAELVLREQLSLEKEALVSEPIVRSTLFEIWLALTAEEQQILAALAQKKQVQKDDTIANLVKFDLLDEKGQFKIPLLEKFVLSVSTNLAKQKITFDQNSKDIKKGTLLISDLLSPQEYRLLKFLILNEGKILDRTQIIAAVWPDAQLAEGISDEAIDQMVFRLRKKIEDEPASPRHITTVKGLGLRFEA